MKKTNLIKGFLIILIGAIMISTTGVFANDEFDYIFDDETGNTSTKDNSSTNNSSSNSNKSNSNSNKSNSNSNKSNSNSNKSNSNTNNTKTNNTNTNNVSSYNNNNTNNLPKTGVEDAIPTMALVVVFGISAVYAYKKINEYNKL